TGEYSGLGGGTAVLRFHHQGAVMALHAQAVGDFGRDRLNLPAEPRARTAGVVGPAKPAKELLHLRIARKMEFIARPLVRSGISHAEATPKLVHLRIERKRSIAFLAFRSLGLREGGHERAARNERGHSETGGGCKHDQATARGGADL